MVRKTAVATFIVAALAFTPGVALADPVFPVLNTSESPPDGVWFRYGPDPAQTNRVTGVGVYMNEHVIVKCYWHGTPFGAYGNDVWYYATDQERPVAAGQANEGWINTHYVDDGMTADHSHPSLPQCAQGSGNGGVVGGPAPGGSPGGGQTPTAVSPAAGYFAPYKMSDDDGLHVKDPATLNVEAENWSSTCTQLPTTAYSAANALLARNQSYKTLAGWSWGRAGVIAYLKSASMSQLDALSYVLLIDPGVYDELNDCDKTLKAGAALARWLAENPRAHLAIISTSAITQRDDSKGIQEIYFNAIRDRSTPKANIRARVLTCNYSLPGKTARVFGRSAHQRAMLTGQYWIQHEIGTSTKSCPWLSEGDNVYKPTAGWHA
jgi:hypothetical protein